MEQNVKKGIISLLGGLGVIALLLGIFTSIYSFGVGLIIAIAIWILTGSLTTMMGLKKGPDKEKEESKRFRVGGILWPIFGVILVVLGVIFIVSYFTSRGSGKVTTETRQVSNFDKINLSGSGNITLTQGETESLKISGEDNIINKITTEVNGSTLDISNKGIWVVIWPTKPINYEISVKNLSEIRISGSGKVNNPNPINGESLKLAITGSGEIRMTIEYTNLTTQISGSGDIELTGKAENQTLEITGSGEYNGRNLTGKKGEIKITGSGSAVVNVAENLNGKISGSGKIQYLGTPQITQESSGSGKIEKIN